MSNPIKKQFQLLPVTAALMLVFGSAHAEMSAEVLELTSPNSFINIGAGGYVSTTDMNRFAQYTGLSGTSAFLLDFDYSKRDESGLWTTLAGRDFGRETRELTVSQQKQGDWKYAFDYNQIVRLDPYVIHTGMTGIGTASPTINLIETPALPSGWDTANGLAATNGVPGQDASLRLKRTAYGLSGDKWITSGLQVAVSFRSESKTGSRLFGRVAMSDASANPVYPQQGAASANGGWAMLLTPEPIDSKTSLIETKLNYHQDKLAVTAGYYGTIFVNNFGSLAPVVPGTLNRGTLWTTSNCNSAGCSSIQDMASSPVALPPDTQSHQFYVSGNYAFSTSTNSNFKLAYTTASQNESFTAAGLTPPATAAGSLGGLVTTTLAQFGLTMKPVKQLSLNASFRYEDRMDKTPLFVYNNNGGSGGPLDATTNWASGSLTRTTAKLDGIYRLHNGKSLLLGLDWERKTTPLPPSNTELYPNQVFFRPTLTEQGLRTEFRKNLSDTINGAIGLEYKMRRGNDADWVTPTGTAGNALVAFDPSGTSGNAILPIVSMDRNRTKLRTNVDWEVTEKISLQGVLEHAQDSYLRAYPGGVSVEAGARTVNNDSGTLDASYRLTDNWNANGFVTHSLSRFNVNQVNLGEDSLNTEDVIGFGLSGKFNSKLSFGLDYLFAQNVSKFDNSPSTGVIAGWSGQSQAGNYLPTIRTRSDSMNVHGKYALNKASDVLVGFKYQRYTTDDWQWGYNGTPFLYSDNTTVSEPANQTVKFISASYFLKF